MKNIFSTFMVLGLSTVAFAHEVEITGHGAATGRDRHAVCHRAENRAEHDAEHQCDAEGGWISSTQLGDCECDSFNGRTLRCEAHAYSQCEVN